MAVAAANAAVIRAPVEEEVLVVPAERRSARQPRTLGLLTAGTNVLTTGLGAAGSAAATAIGVTSAVKPLVFLGLGKCEFGTTVMHHVFLCFRLVQLL